ncbi:uncharacterized protein A4U43_C08F20550 [Asparagus officinalis]|nr:uncharacterized protein A4U43_C08F20550 [Asparagus officinalis]
MSAFSLLHSSLLKPSSILYSHSFKLFSSSSLGGNPSKKSKYQQPIAVVLEVGGVKIAKDEEDEGDGEDHGEAQVGPVVEGLGSGLWWKDLVEDVGQEVEELLEFFMEEVEWAL